MATPQDNDPSGSVVQESLRLASRVDADEDAADLAPNLLSKRQALKERMRARQAAHDNVLIADGRVSSCVTKTDREIVAFGKRVAGHLVTAKLAGEKHPLFLVLFADETPSTFLPKAREDRTKQLEAFKKRIEAPSTPAEIRKDAKDLLRAMAREFTTVTHQTKTEDVYQTVLAAEEKAKTGTVVACRKLAGDVQSRFAEEPARVRAPLGKAVTRKPKGKTKTAVTGETPVKPTPPSGTPTP